MLEIAGGERWFSAIYVEDLAEGLIAAARVAARRRARLFPGSRQASLLEQLGATAARIMAPDAHASLRVPFARGQRGRALAREIWARITRKPGIISREKVAEARCMSWTCDPARAAAELGFEAPTSIDAGLAEP